MAKNDPQAHKNSTQQDDFKLIGGINQGIENRLHKAGIRTYAQLASLTPQKILLKSGQLKGYTAKRIEDEDWIGQARKRSKHNQSTRQKAPRKTTAKPEIRQHYENFTIEFLLDEKNVGRRTRVLHVQSGDADTWAGWEPDQLVSFLARHASINLPHGKEAVSTASDSDQGMTIPAKQPSFVRTETAEISPSQTSEENSNSFLVSRPIPQNIDFTGQSTIESSHPRVFPPEETKKLFEEIHLLEWQIFPQDTNVPSHILSHDQTFDVRLMLALERAMVHGTNDMKYCATIFAKQIGTRNRQSIAEVQNIISVRNNINLNVNCVNLSPGTYRLEVLLTAESARNEAGPHRHLMELVECGLFQVY